MSPEQSEASDWLAYAAEDLAYGRLGMEELPRAASWSFQQSAEKALKAIWLAFRKHVPRTHDVAFLLSELEQELSPPIVVRDAVLRLAEIAPSVRYPSDDLPNLTLHDSKEYAEAAEVVYGWASEIISRTTK